MSAPNIYAEKKGKNIRTGYGRYLKKLKSLPSIPSFASAGILKITPNSRAKVSNRAKISPTEFQRNRATAAIIWKHRIASIAQKISLRQNTFFDDGDDSSDGSDYMETGLSNEDGNGKENVT